MDEDGFTRREKVIEFFQILPTFILAVIFMEVIIFGCIFIIGGVLWAFLGFTEYVFKSVVGL